MIPQKQSDALARFQRTSRPFQTKKEKPAKVKHEQKEPLLDAAAGDVATYQQGTAGCDATPAAFRETDMRKAAGQLRSDARLASATPPISWQELLYGQKPFQTYLLLQNTSADEARAKARKPPANNQWLTLFFVEQHIRFSSFLFQRRARAVCFF